MKTKHADLHIHTVYSDGTYRVPEVFRIAKKHKLSAISITDHDSTDSYSEAKELSVNYGVEVISGVELSCEYQGMDIHILGYFVGTGSPELVRYLNDFKNARSERARQMVNLLNNDGIRIDYEDITRISPEGTIARPHIAQLLIEKGYAYNIQDAFSKYISADSKYYVAKYKISPEKAFQLIHNSGGLAFAAHPHYLKDQPEMIMKFKESGIDGIETVHSSYDEETAFFLDSLCDHYDLLRSGGSDCHGKRKSGQKLLGKYFIPYEYIQKMKNKIEEKTI